MARTLPEVAQCLMFEHQAVERDQGAREAARLGHLYLAGTSSAVKGLDRFEHEQLGVGDNSGEFVNRLDTFGMRYGTLRQNVGEREGRVGAWVDVTGLQATDPVRTQPL